MAQADRILFQIQAEVGGGQDVSRLSGLLNHLGTEIQDVSQVTQSQRQQMVAAEAELRRIAATYAVGSAEAQRYAQLAQRLGQQISRIDSAAIDRLVQNMRGIDQSSDGAVASLRQVVQQAQAMRAGLAAGSAEARRLDGVIQAASQSIARINNRNISQLERDLRAASRAGNQSEAELRQVAQAARQMGAGFAAGSAEAQRLAAIANRAEQELEQLEQAARRAGRSTQDAGRSAQQAGGGFTRLQAGIVSLGAGLVVLQQVGQATAQLKEQAEEWAEAANKAATATRVFDLTLERFNVNTDEANAVVKRLADQFGMTEEQVKDSMTTLIRAGFRDMGQLEQVMTGAAASAIAFGRSAQDGFERVGDAAVTGLSAALNAIGISENLGPALDQYAKSVGKTADALDEQEKAQVLANLVLKATATEVGALAEIQNEYVRSKQDLAIAEEKFAVAMGQMTMPYMIQYNRQMAELATGAQAMAEAIRDGKDPLDALAQAFPEMAGPVESLRQALGSLSGDGGNFLTTLSDTANELRGEFETTFSQIRSYYEAVLVPMWQEVAPLIGTALEQVAPLVSSLVELIGNAFALMEQVWVSVGKPVWDAVGPTVQAAVELVGKWLHFAVDTVSGIVAAIAAMMRGDWAGAWKVFVDTVESSGTAAVASLARFMHSLEDTLGQAASAAWEKAKAIGNSIKDGIITALAGLGALLIQHLSSELDQFTAWMPDWVKQKLGIDAAQGALNSASDYLSQVGGASSGQAFGGFKATDALGDDILSQAFKSTGNATADAVAGWCARWVRLTLKKAEPEAASAIEKWFGGNANDVKNRMRGQGLLRNDWGSLKPGDVVIYDDNHIGIYMGKNSAGQDIVRGNNQWGVKNGRSVVSNEVMTSLGSRAGFVSIADVPEIAAKLGMSVTAQPKTNTSTSSSAPPPAATPPKPATLPLPVLPDGKPASATDVKNAGLTVAEWNKYGQDAINKVKELRAAEASQNEAWILQARQKIRDYEALGEAQKEAIAFAKERVKAESKSGSSKKADKPEDVGLTPAQWEKHRVKAMQFVTDLHNARDKGTAAEVLAAQNLLQAYAAQSEVHAKAAKFAEEEYKRQQQRSRANKPEDAGLTPEQWEKHRVKAMQFVTDLHNARDKGTAAEVLAAQNLLDAYAAQSEVHAKAAKFAEEEYKRQQERSRANKPEDVGLSPEQWEKHRVKAMQFVTALHDARDKGTAAEVLAAEELLRAYAAQSEVHAKAAEFAEKEYGRQQQRDRDSESRQKEAQERLAAINRARLETNLETAQLELRGLEQLREKGLREAGDDAKARLKVEQDTAEAIYQARLAVADIEKQQRDKKIKEDPNLTEDLRRKQLENSQTAYNQAVASALAERQSRLDDARKEEQERSKQQEEALARIKAAATLERAQNELQTERDLQAALSQERELALAAAGDNLAERSRIVDEFAQREIDSAERVALAELMVGKRQNEQQRAADIKAIKDLKLDAAQEAEQLAVAEGLYLERNSALYRAYNLSVDQAVNGVIQSQGDAFIAFQDAEISLRKSYEDLGKDMVASARAGQFSGDAYEQAAESLKNLREQAQKQGLSGLVAELDAATAAALDLAVALQMQGENHEAQTTYDLSRAQEMSERGDGAGARAYLAEVRDALELAADQGQNVASSLTMVSDAIEAIDKGWEQFLQGKAREADLQGFTESLKALTDEELRAARAAADLALNQEQLSAVVAEQQRRDQQVKERPDRLAELSDAGRFEELERQFAQGLVSELEYINQREALQVAAAQRAYDLAVKNGEDQVVALAQFEAAKTKAEADGAAERLALSRRIDEQRRTAENQMATARLEEQHRLGLVTETEYVNQREALQVAARTAEWEVASGVLKEGSDGYKAAYLQFQADLLDIQLQGISARADAEKAAWERLSSQLGQVSDLARQFTGGEDNWGSVAGDWMSMNTQAYAQFMSGDVFGAIMTTVNGIGKVGDAIMGLDPAFAKWKTNMLEIVDLQREAAGAMNYGGIANPYHQELTQDAANREKVANAGFFQRVGWAIFGGKPKVMAEEAAREMSEAGKIFAGLAGDLAGTIESEFMNAFESGDWSGAQKALDKSLNGFIAKAALQVVMANSRLSELLKAVAEARAAGGDGAAELAALREELARVQAEFQTVAEGLPGYAEAQAAKLAELGRDLRQRELDNAQTALDLQYNAGLLSTEDYERRKLELALARIQLEMEAALAAEGLTAEQIALIQQQYQLQAQQAQQQYDLAAAERARELATLRMNNAEKALDIEERLALQGVQGEAERFAVQKAYAERRLQLTLARLDAELAAELSKAGLSEEMQAEIRERFRLERESALAEYQGFVLDGERQLADAQIAEAKRVQDERESMLDSWRGALKSGIGSLIDGPDSVLEKLHAGIRDRISQGIQEGLIAKRISASLDPLFEQLNGALENGLNTDSIMAQIGARLAPLSMDVTAQIGPIFDSLNRHIPDLTQATKENTAALREAQWQQTQIVNLNLQNAGNGNLRAKLARYA